MVLGGLNSRVLGEIDRDISALFIDLIMAAQVSTEACVSKADRRYMVEILWSLFVFCKKQANSNSWHPIENTLPSIEAPFLLTSLYGKPWL